MNFKLEDLLDIPKLQKLLDSLSETLPFHCAISDNDGRVLTATAWQDICTKFHRGHPECEKACRESGQTILSHILEANPSVTCRCPHGLFDSATPILIDGLHLGSVFVGQHFLDPPDLEAVETAEDTTAHTRKIMAQGEDRFESRHRRKEGSLFDVEISAQHQSVEGGRFVVFLRDITERKQAERLEHAICEIARAPETAKTLDDLYRSVHQIIKGLMPAENFYVALYDEKEDLLSYPYFADEVDVPDPPQKLDRGLTAYVLRTGSALLCDAALDEEMIRRGEVEMVGAPKKHFRKSFVCNAGRFPPHLKTRPPTRGVSFHTNTPVPGCRARNDIERRKERT